MPSYDYKCEKCGHVFEERRGFWEKEKEVKCPECGDKDCRRVFSGFNTSSSRRESYGPKVGG